MRAMTLSEVTIELITNEWDVAQTGPEKAQWAEKWADVLIPSALANEEFRNAETRLSEAYLRLRAMLPGAFDTPFAPSADIVWKTTEAALARLISTQRSIFVIEGETGVRLKVVNVALNADGSTTVMVKRE